MRIAVPLLLLSACFADLSEGAKKKKKTQSARAEALSPAEQLETFQLPEGFVIELVASEENGLINPIDLSFDDAGRLWTQTAEMYPLDPIGDMPWGELMKLLESSDPAAIEEQLPEFARVRDLYRLKKRGTDKVLLINDPTQKVTGTIPAFAEGLTIPQSVLPYRNGVFVAHGSELLFLKDTDGDGKADSHETTLTGFGFNDSHTMAHTLVRGPGGWVHLSHGALNGGKVKAPKSGAEALVKYSKIVRFSLDGEQVEVQNAGLQNIWGFHLKDNGQWYGTEANDMGWSLTPLHPMMGYKGIGNDKLREYQPIPPVFHRFRVSGTGISGLAYDENGSAGFPKEWKEVGFLANPITNTINCVIADRNPDGGVVSKHLKDFLSSSDDWFRPVNIEFGPDGCLYVVDWYNKIVSHNEVPRSHPDRDHTHGRLWRIRHRSQTPRPTPNLIEASNKELPRHLSSEILWEKRAAWHQIADRQAKELIPELKAMLLDKTQTLSTRIVALWSLESLQGYDTETWQALVADPDANLRREALRSLATLKPDLSEVVLLVSPLMQDSHYMVKEQALRTLAEIEAANAETIQLLVAACIPDVKGVAWDSGYKVKFQRYLARKALEQYPSELTAFLQSPAAQEQPATHLDWAAQALGGKEKVRIFIENWKKGDGTLDAETLVSIAPDLRNPEIFKLLSPEFAKDGFVELALEVQPRVKSSFLVPALKAGLKKLINSSSPDDQALALRTAISFQSPDINSEIRAAAEVKPLQQVSTTLLNALAITPKQNGDIFKALANNREAPLSLRLLAIDKLFLATPEQAKLALTRLVEPLSASEKESVANTLAQTRQGGVLVLDLIKNKLLAPNQVSLANGERIASLFPKNPDAKKIRSAIAAEKKAQDDETEERFQGYRKALASLQGNPEAGKATFTACLSCHAVGNEGQDIAPALDGSANRDVDHLLTAIVKPNEAMEGGYRLHRVVKKNGEISEGFLYQANDFGTTLAYMGGGKVFIPNEQIQDSRAVNGQSFMPSIFGGLPDQTMVDLVSYIKTLN